jgi:hypothetical protein
MVVVCAKGQLDSAKTFFQTHDDYEIVEWIEENDEFWNSVPTTTSRSQSTFELEQGKNFKPLWRASPFLEEVVYRQYLNFLPTLSLSTSNA